MSDKNQQVSNEKELLNLGRKLQDFYDSGYVNKKQALLFSFLKGLAAGFGAFLGGTIIIALLLWILSFFDHVPLVGHVLEILQHTLNTAKSH